MCGIFGIVGDEDLQTSLLTGLIHLEYRGYDSAGMASIVAGKLQRVRAAGKLIALEQKLHLTPLLGTTGISHTRWATHGIPNEENAHPHIIGKVAIVHNGIVENYNELRQELELKDYKFTTDTDTEVIAALIDYFLHLGYLPLKAVQATITKLCGNYALLILCEDDKIIGVKNGSPLIIGLGQNKNYISSDIRSLSAFTSEVIYLEDGDLVELTANKAEVYDIKGVGVQRPYVKIATELFTSEKGPYPHFMLKEIYEQPSVIKKGLNHYFYHDQLNYDILPDFSSINTLDIVACGSSFYAGNVAKYWFEELTSIKVNVDIASEYRYRPIKKLHTGHLTLFISQSGETIDTLAALKYIKEVGYPTITLLNVENSSMARVADSYLLTDANWETGVASTKAFSAQLLVLFALALKAASDKKEIETSKVIINNLYKLPFICEEILNYTTQYQAIAQIIANCSTVIYTARGIVYPIASEGALKLKELSYIHAESIAAGELKHGPLALVDEDTYVIAIAPQDRLFTKTYSNLQEIHARKGNIICIADTETAPIVSKICQEVIVLPKISALFTPFSTVIPLQLIAYYAALLHGCDVDQPRNLAKSVTVE